MILVTLPFVPRRLGVLATILGLGLVMVASAVASGSGTARALAGPRAAPAPSPTTTPDPSGASGQSFKDGCTREPSSLLDGNAPSWAFIYETGPGNPPPPPQWVEGTVRSAHPLFDAVTVGGGDLPSAHDAYDYTANILPDPQYFYLVAGHRATPTSAATGNYAGTSGDTGLLHSEWEDTAIPKFAWAEDGDRITELGNWVWDCDHWGVPTEIFSPDYVLPKLGQPCLGSLAGLDSVFDPAQCTITGEGSEFHSYRAVWDVRHQSNSPEAESEAELFVSTQATRAGIIAGCNHKFPPNSGLPNPAFKPCVITGHDWQDVSGDYSFYLPAPPKPSAAAHLTYRAVDRGSRGDAPAPTLTPEGNGVRVTFHLATRTDQQLKMAYTAFAGWDQLALPSVPTHLHVTLDKVTVHRAMDPGCSLTAPLPGCANQSLRTNQATIPPGEWNLFYDIEGQWGQWYNREFDPQDGDSLPGNQAADIYVPAGARWHIYMAGRECDLGALAAATGVTGMMADCPNDHEIADDNDVPGTIRYSWPSALASLGTHTINALTHKNDPQSTCPDTNPQGCYSLTYTVSEVLDASTRVRNTPRGLPNTRHGIPLIALLGLGGTLLALAVAGVVLSWVGVPRVCR